MKDRRAVIYLGLSFSFAVMFFGLLFGSLIYNYQTTTLNAELQNLKVRNQEIILFSSILQNDLTKDGFDCNFYGTSLNNFAMYVNEYGRILEKYYESVDDIDSVKDLQKDYVVTSLNLYFSIDKYNSVCKDNAKNLILYLYPYNCGTCDGITKTINNIVYGPGGTFSFSIPSEVGLESVDFIKSYYGVSIIPSVVVNGVTLGGPDSFNYIEDNLIAPQ